MAGYNNKLLNKGLEKVKWENENFPVEPEISQDQLFSWRWEWRRRRRRRTFHKVTILCEPTKTRVQQIFPAE